MVTDVVADMVTDMAANVVTDMVMDVMTDVVTAMVKKVVVGRWLFLWRAPLQTWQLADVATCRRGNLQT
jgi:hypothetical protein